MGKEVLNVAKLCNQFLCRLFSNARTSRNIVGSISHQSQQVDDLQRRLNGILVLDFFDTHDFESLVVVSGAVHEYVLADQLSVVFVGSHHISGNAAFPGFRGQCSDDIVGFISGHFKDRNAIGTDNILDNRDGETDHFRRFLTLCLVFRIGFMTERRACRIECYTDVSGVFLFQDILQCIDKSEDG